MSGGTFGTNWLDLSSTSNRYTRTYIQGFMDISGGNLIVRNNNLYLTRGDASINGNLILGRDLSVNGNVSANVNTMSSLIVSNNINMNGVVAQFSSNIAVPSTYVSYIDLSGYLYKTSLTSYNLNNINVLTPFYADADVSFNSRLFLTGDASFGNRLFLGGDASFNKGLFVGSDASFGGKLFAIGDVSLNSRLYVGSDASFSGKLFVNGDASFNKRLFIGSDASINSLTVGRSGGNILTNTAFGVTALTSNTTGISNTAIGYQAGYAGTANTTGSNNTYIGYQAQANANNYSNSTALGSGATITGSNQVVLGTSTETVKYNKVSPIYSTVPTWSTNDIGYNTADTNSNSSLSTTNTTYMSLTVGTTGLYLIMANVIFIVNSSSTVTSYLKIDTANSLESNDYQTAGKEVTVRFTTPREITSGQVVSFVAKTSTGTGTVGTNVQTGTLRIVRIA